MDLAVNLPATATELGASGDAEALSLEYYDNLGKSATMVVTFTPTVPAAGSSNEWTMTIADSASAGAVVGEYTLQFDDTRGAGGTLQSVTTVSGGYPFQRMEHPLVTSLVLRWIQTALCARRSIPA